MIVANFFPCIAEFCTPSQLAARVSNSQLVPPGTSNAEIKSVATDLQKDLEEVEHRWYQLGVLLGLPVHILDGFQDNYEDLSERLRAMLQEWLLPRNTEDYETPSWRVLVDAVKHSAGGGNPKLAGELAIKASAPVPTVQSPAQPSSSLPSGQQPSSCQTPPAQQQQNPQIVTPNQVQPLYVGTRTRNIPGLKSHKGDWNRSLKNYGFLYDTIFSSHVRMRTNHLATKCNYYARLLN